MNRKQKIIISITGIVIVTLILLGLTYGYFLTTINGNTNSKSISVTMENLDLAYGDGNAYIIQSSTPLVPSSNPIGQSKTFTVTNKGGDTEYVVIIDNVDIKNATTGAKTTFVSNDFRYTLTCKNKDNTNCDNQATDLTALPINGGVMLGNKIAKGNVQTYTLTMYYIDTGVDQSADMNKTYNARVNIEDINRVNPYSDNKQSLAYNIINNAKEKTNGTELLAIPKTKVAEEISSSWVTDNLGESETVQTSQLCAQYFPWLVGDTESSAEYGESVSSYGDAVGKYVYDQCDMWTKYLESYDSATNTLKFKSKVVDGEKILSISPDDYGTSYYYRGIPEDNYVTFANKCWRIVRIEGDGSVKLILEDKNEICSNKMNGDWDAFMISWGYIKEKVTNSSGLQSSYDIYIADYFNDTDSMKEQMDSWLASLGTSTNLIKNDTWCLVDNTKVYNYNNPYNLLDMSINDLMYNNTAFYYQVEKRLHGLGETANATLKCSGKTFPSKIGTLTADEVVFAGGTFNKTNYNYFLMNNYSRYYGQAKDWFTLSLSGFSSRSDYVFDVNGYGHLIPYMVSNGSNVRPSISLKTGISISGGNGTKKTPYIISE